jgi:phage shock protein PspC (stress-responsive transcriptional regulator)
VAQRTDRRRHRKPAPAGGTYVSQAVRQGGISRSATGPGQGRPRVRWGGSPMGTDPEPTQNELMTDYTSQTPPPGPNAAQPHRLTRSTKERMVAGVAGGLAEYLDVDPVAVRIGFVIASFLLGGIGGPILYALMWVIVPEEGKTSSIASDALKSGPWQHSGQDAGGN